MLKQKILFELKDDLCRLLVEESSDDLFVIKGDRLEYCNLAFARLTGLEEGDIDSVSARELIESIVHPDELESFGKWWSQAFNGCQSHFLGPLKIRYKTGKSGQLTLSATTGQEKRIIGVVRDISELIESQNRLREKERILSSLIEQAQTPVFIVQNGIIKFANPAVFDTFGYYPEEVIDKEISKYLPEDIEEKIMDLYQARLQSPDVSRRLEFSLLHKNGQQIEVDVDFNFIEYEGKPAEIVLTHDITERKRIEARLEETLEKLRKAFGASINILNRIAEIKDPYTAGHQKRVAELARAIAIEMELEPEKIDGLRLAAQIHDIGKIIVPAEILSKPGPLSEIELQLIKNHVIVGYELLKDIDFPWPIVDIIYQHHERMDGSGYPRGLKGEEIMTEARILSVADVVEAMVSFRPYREAHSIEEAISEIKSKRGQLYDEKVVDVCLDLLQQKGFRFDSSF